MIWESFDHDKSGTLDKEETKRLMSQKKQNRTWIYNMNLDQIKMVKNEELELYLGNGWIKGSRKKSYFNKENA